MKKAGREARKIRARDGGGISPFSRSARKAPWEAIVVPHHSVTGLALWWARTEERGAFGEPD